MGLQSFVPAEDEGEEESQTSRDGKYFSPDPLEAPLDGSRAGAARAAKLAGDSSVPWLCREPLPVAADSSLERANVFLLRGRCQHLPSPCAAALAPISVCLSVCLLTASCQGAHMGPSRAALPALGAHPRSSSAPPEHEPSWERISEAPGERRGQASPPGPCHPGTTSCSRGDLGMLKPSRLLQQGVIGEEQLRSQPSPSQGSIPPPLNVLSPQAGVSAFCSFKAESSPPSPPLPAPRCPWRRLCVGMEQERRVPVALQPNTSPGMGAAPGQPCKTAARDKTHAVPAAQTAGAERKSITAPQGAGPKFQRNANQGQRAAGAAGDLETRALRPPACVFLVSHQQTYTEQKSLPAEKEGDKKRRKL